MGRCFRGTGPYKEFSGILMLGLTENNRASSEAMPGAGMDFPNLCQSIASPALRAVALHWDKVRGAKKMPSWEDLRPKEIARYLPLVWAYKFDVESQEFIGRLAGDRIARAYGKSFRGLTLAQIHTPPDRYEAARIMLMRVISEPAIFLGHGRIFQLNGEFRSGERIVLPLSHDGVVADGVFGATEAGSFPLAHQPVQGINDAGQWHRL
jgi:hypothetical protein